MRLGHATLARGFTLIELMIGVAIFALLTVLAVPMYGDFMANTQVRTAAESVLTGIRLAQSEAVRRGIPVRFELVGSTGWQVVFLAVAPPPTASRTRTLAATTAWMAFVTRVTSASCAHTTSAREHRTPLPLRSAERRWSRSRA
jgi:prepilin-type N-terminal cleavage/methylation domain-containing protein